MSETRVLVVDDEPDIRLMLRLLIEQQGCIVDEAADGAEALVMLKESHYAVMFLDLLMPQLDGRQVLDRLPEELLEAMPVVVLTALDADREILTGYERGATVYLTKPFSNSQVVDVLNYLTADLTEEERTELEARI